MTISSMLHYLAIVGCAASLTVAAPTAKTARAPGPDHIVLYNCRNGDTRDSHVGYYPGDINGPPTSVVKVSNTKEGFWHVWEGSQIDEPATFPDLGMKFSWDIPISCPVNRLYVGNANSGSTDWAGWYAKDVYKYTREDGASCGSAYMFDHSVTTGKQCTRAQLTVMPEADYVDLPIDLGRSAKDIFSLVLDQFDHDTAMTLTTDAIDIGKGAKITFAGHGAVPGKTLLGAARALVDNLVSLDGVAEEVTETRDNECLEYAECVVDPDRPNGPPCAVVCLKHGPRSWTHLRMAKKVTIFVTNEAINTEGVNSGDSSSQGELTYTLEYEPPQLNCGLFSVFMQGIKLGSTLPPVSEVLGPISWGVELAHEALCGE